MEFKGYFMFFRLLTEGRVKIEEVQVTIIVFELISGTNNLLATPKENISRLMLVTVILWL